MSGDPVGEELRSLLALVEDTQDIVLPPAHSGTTELFAVWSAARAEANLAYDEWCGAPGLPGYVADRAAEDRADAAEVALSRAA